MKPQDANAISVAHGSDALRRAFDNNVVGFEPDADAAQPEADELPLFSPLPPSEPYPISALGKVLGPAASAIARKVQVPPAMAAQSVLAVAALAAQPHGDVKLPYGQSRPLSLFMLTIADSGDRKTTSDREASWAIRKPRRLYTRST